MFEANAATLNSSGDMPAATAVRAWLAVPAVVMSTLLQQAVYGWRLPLSVLWQVGFRTAPEIA